MKVSLTITHDEVVAALKHHFNLPIDTEVIITGEANTQGAQSTSEDSEWISVPPSWDLLECPPEANHFPVVEVMFRSGRKMIGWPNDWTACWKQMDDDDDIIKYRQHME